MNNTVCLLGCGAAKKDYACEAQELYVGSFFKRSLVYAKLYFNNIVILSAKYGILELTDIVEPYNLKISDCSKTYIKVWRSNVVKQLLLKYKGYDFISFAGNDYNSPLKKDLLIREPLKGLGIGRRYQWFCERIEEYNNETIFCGKS